MYDYSQLYFPLRNVKVIKKDGTTKQDFNINKVIIAVGKSAKRINKTFSEEEEESICQIIVNEVDKYDTDLIPIAVIHSFVEQALDTVAPAVAKSYRDYRNYKQDFVEMFNDAYMESQQILFRGDKENANTDSSLVATKRTLTLNGLEKRFYEKFFMTPMEIQARRDGYIHVHDMSSRRYTMNCCLADIIRILTGGFEMGNVWYNEPKTLDVAFDVIGDIVMSMAGQQYGGFTLPEVETILAPYAQKSYNLYVKEYLDIREITDPDEEMMKKADKYAFDKVSTEMKQGFQGWEYKFNTVSSSRGDYPFITISLGLGTGRFEKLASITALQVRMKGQGKEGHKKPVLFPKIVFLYDKALHEGKDAPLYDVYKAGVACSMKTMYPDWLSLTGEGYVPSIYKKYGKAISPMGKCKLAHVKHLEPCLMGVTC